MEIQQLVKMANQIGEFFAVYPDTEMAREEITAHLQRNWAPRMRAAMLAHIDQAETLGLAPLVAAAVRRLPQLR